MKLVVVVTPDGKVTSISRSFPHGFPFSWRRTIASIPISRLTSEEVVCVLKLNFGKNLHVSRVERLCCRLGFDCHGRIGLMQSCGLSRSTPQRNKAKIGVFVGKQVSILVVAVDGYTAKLILGV